MQVIGYLCTLLIGLSLGLMGAGGSILTVPVLVYFFRLEPASAVRYSLFIVGSTSSFSSIVRFKQGDVLIRKGIIFASISILIVLLVRKMIVPHIPEIVFQGTSVTLTFGNLSMIIFSMLMIMVAKTMIIAKRDGIVVNVEKPSSITVLLGCAVATGILTGFLGAGGGFLIVPALTLFFDLDIKKAVGTSLFIISLNTMAGFFSNLVSEEMNWMFLLTSTLLAIIGAFIGQRIAYLFNTKQLRLCFGWFVLIIALIILGVQANELS